MTTFPSKIELQRLVEWGPVVTKSVKATMTIEESPGLDVFRYELPKVWVQFRGFPDKLCKFSFIWAVGYMIGASRFVDMKFTNAHGIARVKVACLNPELIPDYASIAVGDFVYDLQFRVEENIDPENPIPINMDIDLDKDDHEMGEDNSGKDTSTHNLGDSEKSPQAPIAPAANNNKGLGKQAASLPPRHFTEMLQGDNPSGTLLDNQTTMHGGMDVDLMSSQPTTEVGKVLVNSALSPSKNVKNNSTASPKHPSQLPSCSSKRTAAIADQNSLEWAAKLKAKLNLDSPDEKGNNTVNVFDSLDDATIISHFSSVGVKFGPSNISAEIVLEGLRKGCVDSMSSLRQFS